MQEELPPHIYEEVLALSEKGNLYAEKGDYALSLNEFNLAWELLPEPKADWNASTWLLAGMADSFFMLDDFKQSRKALEYAFHCPDALGNPFLHLRFGQVLFEADELDEAANQLLKAYMFAGVEVFELEDAKYLSFLKTRAIL